MSIFTNLPRTDGQTYIVIEVQTQGSCNVDILEQGANYSSIAHLGIESASLHQRGGSSAATSFEVNLHVLQCTFFLIILKCRLLTFSRENDSCDALKYSGSCQRYTVCEINRFKILQSKAMLEEISDVLV